MMDDNRNMENQVSFRDYVFIACGTLSLELNHLKKDGFLDAKKVLYTQPGRHEIPRELKSQLTEKIREAKKYSEKIIVVYGGKFCYIDVDDPSENIDKIIRDQANGISISRINATHCIDMLASKEEREKISNGEKVWWLTPGWIVYRKFVFQDWDKGKANENFPQHTGGAILLDGIDFWNKYVEEHPEKVLEFSDWMGIAIQPYNITLDRLKKLLLEQRGKTRTEAKDEDQIK
jgi:hypothetical protein